MISLMILHPFLWKTRILVARFQNKWRMRPSCLWRSCTHETLITGCIAHNWVYNTISKWFLFLDSGYVWSCLTRPLNLPWYKTNKLLQAIRCLQWSSGYKYSNWIWGDYFLLRRIYLCIYVGRRAYVSNNILIVNVSTLNKGHLSTGGYHLVVGL